MSHYRCSLLVVDDEPPILASLTGLLNDEFEVLTADSAEAAQAWFARRPIDVVLVDQRLPGLSGVQLLEWVRDHSAQTVRLMMTGLARLEDVVDAINFGQVHGYLFKPWRADQLLQILRNAARTFALEWSHEQLLQELRDLNLALENRVQERTLELEEANRQLQQKNSMLRKLALTDPLTGLPNRRAMNRLVRTELRRRERHPACLALGIADVDHFKDVNSRYLLPGGDHALRQLGQVLGDALRATDTVGRIGGEEFLIVAPDTCPEGAAVLAERIRATVEATPVPYKGQTIRLTVSLGFVVAEPRQPVTYDEMKRAAAAALGAAKTGGRNRCVVQPMPRPDGVAG